MSASINRRVFVQSGFLALGSSALVDRNLLAAALSARPAGGRATPADNGRRLVVLQLRGGNDGLNTVVPYAQTGYRSLRPALAIDEQSLLPIDDDLALNAALEPLLPWWDGGRMAIVENVGYPDPDLSHFRSEAIWYTANPETPSGAGWLGRWMGSLPAPSPLGLTSIGVLPSPATLGDGYVPAAVADPDNFGFDLINVIPEDTALRETLLHDGFVTGAAGPAALAGVAATGLAAEDIVAQVAGMPAQTEPPVAYPESRLAADLATAARFLAADLPVRVVWVSTGGFDTHADQAPTHQALWEDVAASVASFMTDLASRGLGGSTAVLIWSEFGRRPAENASLGTDHGTAAPAILLGEPVSGGLYGSPPDLGNLDGHGNLVYDIDFRSVYETVLAEHLGIDPRIVLPDSFERLGVFS